MEKSIYSEDYRIFLHLLRDSRDRADLTQGEVAERLGQTQSFVSKCERGERRIDLVEARAFCDAIGTPFLEFVAEFIGAIKRQGNSKGS